MQKDGSLRWKEFGEIRAALIGCSLIVVQFASGSEEFLNSSF